MTISVIIAAYNAEDTLAETLASVLGQTLLPDEIIVVDDGSNDHTAQVRLVPRTRSGSSGKRTAERRRPSTWA